ncbi:alpha/beta hydrolase fold domain-containing protein [Paenibacillus sp. GCM10012306]|uniref:alpha/beta hydrolase fold domain-containing protein n=1 Tax=Paenibacillus sp. GCM10012306 TaxID=3317342 RepID=UPI00360DB5BF
MRRRLVYVIPILLIVLAAWLYLYDREDNKVSDNQKKEVVSVENPANNSVTPLNVKVIHEQEPVQYLTPAYEVDVKRDILYATKKNETEAEEGLKLDLYQPTGDNNKLRPVFVFIHGGGYSGGGKEDAADFATAMAKRGYVVLSVDYRLKKDPFINFSRTLTDACEDIRDVIHWINDNVVTYGLDADHIVIGGDSAGGHLSINFVNLSLSSDPALVKSVFAIVDIYGGDLTRLPDSKLPPFLIIHGTIDKLVPYQLSVDLGNQLKEQGIYHNLLTMEGVGHDYKNAKYIDEIVETTSHFIWNLRNTRELDRLPENSSLSVASGDVFDIKLPEAYRGNTGEQLHVSLPDGWELIGEENHILQIQTPDAVKRGNLSVDVWQGAVRETAQGFTVNVNVADPLKVHYMTFYDSSHQAIRTHMDVTNRSKNKFSGLLEVDYETARSTPGTFTTAVEALQPGEKVGVDLPELARGQRTLKATNDQGTLVQTAMDTLNALLIPKLGKPLKIDGNLSDWNDFARFEVKDVKIRDWKGEQDLSANGQLSWDANNLYLGVEVTDDKHVQTASGDAIWSGDSIQIGIGIAKPDGTVPSEYHELGAARGDDGTLYKWRWIAPSGFSVGDAIDLKYVIKREDSKTTYEMAIPWEELSRDTALVKKGLKLKFSILVNDNDGDGRRGWVEYNSGIGTAKDIDAFGDLYLTE